MTTRIAWLAAGWLVLGTVACGYRGDGEFSSEGIWPLVNYRLEMPRIPLTSGSTSFRVEGFRSHGSAFVFLNIESPTPRLFAEVATPVRMTLVDEDGEIVFEKSGPLNEHLARMRNEGEISWPAPDEWMVQLAYADPWIRSKAVPFSLDSAAQPQAECVYWGLQPAEIGSGRYTLTLEVGDAAGGEDLTAEISLRSGWK